MTPEQGNGATGAGTNPPQIAARLNTRPIDQELKTSFLDYAMSVIVSRALPDVRDGLKPVHRRVLYGMDQLGVRSDRARRKSALIVGEVMGKYHPHGDTSIYDTIVRMAQDFSLREKLVDGQGNWGCFTGDTKIKLLDGSEETFEELSKLRPGETFDVYAVDANGRVVIGRGHDSRITRRGATLYEIELDNGAKVRCTPDHRFMLRDGSYRRAQDLKQNDSLMPGYFDTAPINDETNDYLRVYQPGLQEFEFVHQIADRRNVEEGVYGVTQGRRVRHHKNFQRFDNRPANIERLSFLEHLHLHSSHIKELWGDPRFRAAQKAGVAGSSKHREANRARIVAFNKDPVRRKKADQRRAASMRVKLQDPALRAAISARMALLWKDDDYRLRMSTVLAGIERRPLTAEQRVRVARIISEKSRKMWADDNMRRTIAAAISVALSRPASHAKLIAAARAKWANPSYRAKFSREHFATIARRQWAQPSAIEFHRRKLLAQWQQAEFVARQREAVVASNRRRMLDAPDMMQRLAQESARSLEKAWKDPAYQSRVMRSKILRYVRDLRTKNPGIEVTPALYEANRSAPWVPGVDKASRYFGNFDQLREAAAHFNHRVISGRILPDKADVYDITVDVHHNFLLAAGVFVHNSVDGDGAAAMRYTEARLAPIAEELLADLDKETVDFVPNYDASLEEPTVLPSKFPNLLVNGSSGIAVGMATNMPPHNLGEIIDATLHLVDNPAAQLADLLQFVKGPDFPTGALLMGRAGIVEAYSTGRGRLVLRGRVTTEPLGKDKKSIIVHELPYQVNKANMLVAIAELVKEKRVEGISDLRDESDRDGMRVVIELKRDADPDVVLNQLYAHTDLQTTFGVQNLALVKRRPVTLGLKDLLSEFVEHRVVVITRRTKFELRKAEERAHILEGLLIALDHVDEVVDLIRKSKSVEEAQSRLIGRFALTEVQAKAILDLRLAKLASLEVEAIRNEHKEILELISRLKKLLSARSEILGVMKEELLGLKKKYATPRKTEILSTEAEIIDQEALIAEHEVVVTITQTGYIKRIPLTSYRSQGRGGKGVIGTETGTEDTVIDLITTSTHDYLMFFTSHGRCLWLKAYNIPESSRYARGKAIVNLLSDLEQGEKVTAAIPVREFPENEYIFFATRLGTVKRSRLSEFKNVRAAGIRAINLDPGDELVGVARTRGHQELVLGKKDGQAVRFNEEDARPMGRAAAGVMGTRVSGGDEVVALCVVDGPGDLLTLKANGRGKRTPIDEYRLTKRGAQGVITINTEENVDGQTVTSEVVGMHFVHPGDEVIVSTEKGVVIRVPVDEIPQKGRGAQGNWVIRPDEGDKVVTMARVRPAPEVVAPTPSAAKAA